MKTLKRLFARYGRLTTVKNKNRAFGSAPTYKPIWVDDEDGNQECLMFTLNQISEARERAKKNPEDVPAKPLFRL